MGVYDAGVSGSGTKEEKKNTGGIIGLGYTSGAPPAPHAHPFFNESEDSLLARARGGGHAGYYPPRRDRKQREDRNPQGLGSLRVVYLLIIPHGGTGRVMSGISPRGATICNIYQMTTRPLPRQDPFACEDVQPHYRVVMSNTNSRGRRTVSLAHLMAGPPPLLLPRDTVFRCRTRGAGRCCSKQANAS